MPEDYEKISPTAVLVAAMRARYTDMPYAGEIYSSVKRMVKPDSFRKTPSFVSRLAKFTPRTMGRLAYLEARYLALNEALNRLDDSYTIIEIASGLSARGLERMLKTSKFIETDLPDMLATKQKVVREVLAERNLAKIPNHHFYTLNALDVNAWEEMGSKFFNGAKSNIVVIHEGLGQYLTRDEKVRLRDNIASFFDRFADRGLWISTDFYPYSKLKKTWLLKLMDRRLEKKTERKFHQFACIDDIQKFMAQGDFEASFQDFSPLLDKLSCIRKVPLDRKKIEEALYAYRICTAIYKPDSKKD